MNALRRRLASACLWLVVAAGFAAVLAAYEWWPTIVHHATSMGEDPLPGARKRPTAEQIRHAQEAWKRRRAE